MFKRMFQLFALSFGLALIWSLAIPAAFASDVPHGRTCATAAQIQPGVWQQAALADANDRAVYRVVMDKRGLLDVRAYKPSADIGKVELLNSACEPMRMAGAGTSVVTGENSLLTTPSALWTLAPGAYFIRFEPSSNGMSRPFTFQVMLTPHYGHDCATAEPMSLVTAKSGELLYPEDREVFRVDLKEEGYIHAWATGPLAAPNQPHVDLYYADCSFSRDMQFADETGLGIATAVLPAGTYYLGVRPQPNTLGRFTLHVEFSEPPSIDHPYSEVPLD